MHKLMDAQINAPDVEGPSDKRGPKRRNSGAFEEDPVPLWSVSTTAVSLKGGGDHLEVECLR